MSIREIPNRVGTEVFRRRNPQYSCLNTTEGMFVRRIHVFIDKIFRTYGQQTPLSQQQNKIAEL